MRIKMSVAVVVALLLVNPVITKADCGCGCENCTCSSVDENDIAANNAEEALYYIADQVETDIVRLTVDSADFAIALNAESEYTLLENTSTAYIDEYYGTPAEYVDGDSYKYVASKGHTLVALTLTTENLDRADIQSAIKGISVIYNDETYTGALYNLCHSDDGGKTWTASTSNGVPKAFEINYYYLDQGETKTERVYFDIAVEVESLTDSFILKIPVVNSSGEYEEFYYSINE
ncbi:MAG: hypothetical protein LUI87_20140 [Lachnospiraceae bacterium]|nr:hypothetical protein [Lachnospiraceae bacterium]